MPERDGIFLNLLMLDLLAVSGKKPTELIRDMWKEFGEFHFGRRDLHIPIEAGMSVVQTLKSAPPAEFAGRKVRASERSTVPRCFWRGTAGSCSASRAPSRS
jgi:hypothetical protein